MKKIIAIILVFTLVCSMIVSAGGDAESSASEMVLNWNLSADPKTLDPGLAGATDDGDIIANTFEGLIRERSGIVEPGIAESWEISPDGQTVTFNLRRSQWSDGSNLTADDFVYSWKRAIDPATASEYNWIWEYTNVVNAADATSGSVSPDSVGVRAIDDYTLEVKLVAPTPYIISLTSFYHFMPVKRSAVEAGPEGAWAKDPELYVSNGPFVLTSYTIGDGLTLEKNPNFWNASDVSIDMINVKFIDESSTAYTAYEAGEFDFLNDVPPAEIPRLVAENPEFYIFPLLGTYYYNFNMDLPRWQDPLVRRALTLSIDREQIVEVLARGNVPAPGFVPPGFRDNDGRDFFETAGNYGIMTDNSQFAEARRLLAEAGYPNGEGFPKFTLIYNTSDGHKLVAEIIQEAWKTNLGIEIDLENQEWAVFQETRRQGDYELSRGGWITDFLDPSGLLAIFEVDNNYNDPNFDNSAFNAAMKRAREATSNADHFNALYEAQEILMTELPVIPVYHYTDYMLSSPQVKGWERSLLSGTDFRYATVER
ncbi:MAG: peptide ABC transporter substrate-binding protein [Salinispira sp.]